MGKDLFYEDILTAKPEDFCKIYCVKYVRLLTNINTIVVWNSNVSVNVTNYFMNISNKFTICKTELRYQF